LITVAPLLAIGANVVRVTILVLIGEHLGASLLDTALHEASGVATFLVVLVTLIFIAGRSNRGAA
jgi:exosortase/archaeosortase family protein